jgi:hypothetical protein
VFARSFLLLFCLASTAHAAPCKDTASCATACDGGDPAACVLALETKFRPLAADKLTANDKKETTCSESLTIGCRRFGAHLWAGVGVKLQRAAAIATWDDACGDSEGADWVTCLAYAKAIEPTKSAEATEIYRDMCRGRDIELACKAAGRLWTRVSSTLRGTKFSVELPAVMRHIEPWSSGSWHVLWSASTMRPDVEISIEGGKLTCTAAPQSAGDPKGKYADMVARYAAKYTWLPTNWADRICKSVRAE